MVRRCGHSARSARSPLPPTSVPVNFAQASQSPRQRHRLRHAISQSGARKNRTTWPRVRGQGSPPIANAASGSAETAGGAGRRSIAGEASSTDAGRLRRRQVIWGECDMSELDAIIAYRSAAPDDEILHRNEAAQRAEIDRRPLARVAIGPPAGAAAHPEETVVPSSCDERLRNDSDQMRCILKLEGEGTRGRGLKGPSCPHPALVDHARTRPSSQHQLEHEVVGVDGPGLCSLCDVRRRVGRETHRPRTVRERSFELWRRSPKTSHEAWTLVRWPVARRRDLATKTQRRLDPTSGQLELTAEMRCAALVEIDRCTNADRRGYRMGP